MYAMSHFSILIALFCAAFCVVDGQLSNERQIYNKIFNGYSPELRPLINSSDSVRVHVMFELTKINKIDELNQQMQMVGFYVAEWKDEYLVWNASDYGNIDRLVVPAKRVWLPDFAIINSADAFYREEFVNDYRVLITSAGLITWSFGGNFIVSCELDLTYYPFDKQKCFMDIENWHYDISEVMLVNATTEVATSEYSENGMWALTGTSSKAYIRYHNALAGIPFPMLQFELFLARKPGYYVINIMMPCFFLACLALLVFWLPPDAGEKVSLGISIILAFGVFSLLISQSTPQTSDSFPLLSIWMFILIIVSSLNTGITIIVLHCHLHLPSRPPTTLRLIFIKTLGRVLCVGGMPEELGEDEVQKINGSDVIVNTDVDSIYKQPYLQAGESKSEGVNSGQIELIHRVTQVLMKLNYISQSIKDGQVDATAQHEWKAIGRVIDRLCFWIHLCVMLIGTIVCFTLRG